MLKKVAIGTAPAFPNIDRAEILFHARTLRRFATKLKRYCSPLPQINSLNTLKTM